MIVYLALGVVLLFVLLAIGRWFSEADPAGIAKALKWAGIAVAIAAAIFLAATGKLVGALTDLTALAILFVRWKWIWAQIKGAAGPAPGNQSTVETPTLRMILDHDSQNLDGEVLRGPLQGRWLSSLDVADLNALVAECRASDPQGFSLLQTYMERRFGANSQRATGQSGAKENAFSRGAMSRDEALEILGLKAGATSNEIKAAYHRLMLKVHPDQGGSTFLAAKINQAREVLLGD
jgi:DnaJ-like protein